MADKYKQIKLLAHSFFVLLMLLSVNTIGQLDGLKQRVLSMNEIVSDPDKQVGNFNPDSMPSLPIGIVKEVAGTKYIIAIDSAYFLPDGAYFSAYMAVEFPGASERIAFAAKDIKFNPKGIIGGEQSRLQLVSQHIIELGPNTKLLLPADGSNYVKWSCNGFEAVNLHGFFLFQDGMMSPPENSTDTCVTAEFSVNVTDVHNMIAMVDFSPFVVKGMDNFTFTVSDAYVDMSDFQNPSQVTLPTCYQETYSSDINLWRGFYLKLFSVELPEELEKNSSPTTIYGQNMFIDDAGVTGFFGVENLFSTSEGKLVGDWGFSVELLEVGFTTNKLTSGRMGGKIIVPPLDNSSLNYNALIEQNENSGLVDYCFVISPDSSVSMSCLNSTLSLYPNSSLTITREDRKFKPKLVLNGKWTLNNSNWKVSGLAFETFTLITSAPYVTEGYFSLVANDSVPKAANFPISFNHVGFQNMNSQLVLGADIALNFGDTSSSNNFSATTSVKIYTLVTTNPQTNKKEWQYDHFFLSTITLAVNTEAFVLNGFINFMDNDPVYGKGFYGGLQFQIPSVMQSPLSMACAFGRVDGYRYWMIDATLPVIIPVSVITITSLTGGIAYHMKNNQTPQQMIASVSGSTNSGGALSQNYVPDANRSLYFKAGIGFKYTGKEEALNGDVVFSIAFNSNGGLENISFAGDAYMMCKRSERATSENYVHGSMNLNYDNQEKTFCAQLSLIAEFSGAITANIWSNLFFSPTLWYIHLGTPSNPCTANIVNLCTANAYFMLGQDLPAMPQPPPQVSSVLGGMSNQRNTADIASGNGIATGMSLQASFDKNVHLTEKIYIYASGYAGAGFDMTLYKYGPTTHCEGSTEPFGMNYWYLQGQLYAYMGLNIGCTNDTWNVKIIEGNAAMLLQGKMAKPSYIYGGVYLQADILGLFNVDLTLDFDFGTNCTIIN